MYMRLLLITQYSRDYSRDTDNTNIINNTYTVVSNT